MNNVLKSLSRNSHGFLQRTVNRKQEYSSKNLEQILRDLHRICMESAPAGEESAHESGQQDSQGFNASTHRHEGSFKSLNLSLRKGSLSGLATPRRCKDNVSVRLGKDRPRMSNLKKKLFVIGDEGEGSVSSLRRPEPVDKRLQPAPSQTVLTLGSQEKTKLRRIRKRIDKLRIAESSTRSHKELFEFGVYKSFPKKKDLITDLVKILRDNIDFFQSNFGLSRRGAHAGSGWPGRVGTGQLRHLGKQPLIRWQFSGLVTSLLFLVHLLYLKSPTTAVNLKLQIGNLTLHKLHNSDPFEVLHIIFNNILSIEALLFR